MRKITFVLALAMLMLAGTIFAQEKRNLAWGTKDAPCMAGVQVEAVRPNLGEIQPATGVIPGRDANPDTASTTLVFPSSYYAAGGAGLRNRTTATINISGLNGGQPAYAGVLYWAIITEFPDTDIRQFFTVTLTNEQNGLSHTFTGTRVGQGISPCWNGTAIQVFRAEFDARSFGPLGVVTSGRYTVTVAPGSVTDGSDPWSVTNPLPPLWEGVSLILVASGFDYQTVVFYDKGIAGSTWGGPFGSATSYTLVLPPTGAPKAPLFTPAAYTSIGADGQVGESTTGIYPQYNAKQVFLNFKQISGPPKSTAPDFEDPDNDWNGAISGPLPQLWDTSTHTLIGYGGTHEVVVDDTNAIGDCLTVVANVVLLEVPHVSPRQSSEIESIP
jgi:hypothetical protein